MSSEKFKMSKKKKLLAGIVLVIIVILGYSLLTMETNGGPEDEDLNAVDEWNDEAISFIESSQLQVVGWMKNITFWRLMEC